MHDKNYLARRMFSLLVIRQLHIGVAHLYKQSLEIIYNFNIQIINRKINSFLFLLFTWVFDRYILRPSSATWRTFVSFFCFRMKLFPDLFTEKNILHPLFLSSNGSYKYA